MFERLFPKRPKETKPLPEPTPQLALGALLVRVAMADREYQAPEVAAIDKILAATFDQAADPARSLPHLRRRRPARSHRSAGPRGPVGQRLFR